MPRKTTRGNLPSRGRSPLRRGEGPPKAMTWGSVMILAVLFDTLRAFFQFFWFFGPALAGVYCTAKVSSWVGSLWGVTETACVAGATYLGFASFAVTAAFGTIMAMATGLLGWMTLGAVLMMKNGRIFRENFLWFGGGLVITQIPFISALPAFTATMWRLRRIQIKIEREAIKKWHKDNDAAILQEKNQQMAMLMQSRAMEQAEAEQQEILNQEQENQLAQQEEAVQERVEQREVESNEIPELSTMEPPSQQGHIVRPKTSDGLEESEVQKPLIQEYGPRTTIPNSTVNMSRRDFLKKAGALAGSSAVSAYASPLTIDGTSYENTSDLSGQTYEQGIETLRKAVLFEKNERVEMFVVKKDGTSAWLKIPENKMTSRPTSARYEYSIYDAIVYDENVDRIDIVHTHPLSTILSDSALISRVRRGEAEPPSMPPSLLDIMNLTIGRNQCDASGSHKLGTIIVDPAGKWRAEISDNPKTLLSIRKMEDLSEPLRNELSEQDDAKEVLKKIELSGGHPSTAFMELMSASSSLSPKTNTLVRDIVSIYKDISKDKAFVNFITKIEHSSGGQYVLSDPKKLEEIKSIYKDVGVNLSFTPHQGVIKQ